VDYSGYPHNARTKQNFEYGILTTLRADFFFQMTVSEY